MSSGSGKHGIPKLSIYCASKFAVIGFTESIAYEIGGGLQAYAVCPGKCGYEMYRHRFIQMNQFSNPKTLQRRFWNFACLKLLFLQALQVEIYRRPMRVV